MRRSQTPDKRSKIVVIGTLDTKGIEIGYVRDRLRTLGAVPIVLDAGILGEPIEVVPDIPRADVAAAGGHTLEAGTIGW